MRKLPKPNFTAQSTFEECIDKVRDSNLKKRLSKCTPLIEDAEKELESKITKGKVHTIVVEKIVNKNVSSKELEKVYTFRMAKKGSPGRSIYDKLLSASPLGICPLCNHRHVETLDHYLPKTSYPRLTVTPINLVPACYPCNKNKLASIPKKSNEETLHPYYDDIENDVWLFAKVINSTPASLVFYTNPPVLWKELLKKRTLYHFESFSLNKLYSIQSAVLIRNLAYRLNNIHKFSGSSGVKKYLSEEAKSRFKIDKNSWQAVFYRTLSADKWYCDGGFRLE
jgi:5-methylcytosine-specific restriction endonuclease McrA